MMNDFDFLVSLIGKEKAYLFIENYGGINYTMPKGDCMRSERLRSIMGDETAGVLMSHFGGSREYIRKFDEISNATFYQAFVDEVRALMADGMSKTFALEILCPKYKISDRHAQDLLKMDKITPDSIRPKKADNGNQLQLNFG